MLLSPTAARPSGVNAPQPLADAAAARAKELTGQLRLRDVMLGDKQGPERLALERLFTVACSHGADLAQRCLGRHNCSAFLIRLNVTTATPVEAFDKFAAITLRERGPGGEVAATEVSLSRIGRESIDYLFDFALSHTAHGAGGCQRRHGKGTAHSHTAASATTSAAVGLDFGGFLTMLTEMVRLMVPPKALPPFSNDAAHIVLLRALFVEGFGRDFVARETSSGVDDFDLSATVVGVFREQQTRDLVMDAFLLAREPSVFDVMSDLHRRQTYQSIALGDAFVEFDGVTELFHRCQLKPALVASELSYRLFERFDVGASTSAAMVDLSGFRMFLLNLACALFATNNALPTPQAKLMHLLSDFLAPHLPARRTLPPDEYDAAGDRPVMLSQVKPPRAVQGSEVWVWGSNFHVREASTGSRCPLYVRLGDRVVLGRCTSATLGSVAVPALPHTDDTAIDAVVTQGSTGDDRTLKVAVKHSTVYAVSISDDRLTWTKSSETILTFEEDAVSYDVDEAFVALLRAVFEAFGRRQSDYEDDAGDVVEGRCFVFLPEWSKLCQTFPKLGVFDDGEITTMIHRHPRFFEVARTHLDAPDPSLPAVDWLGFVALVFRTVVGVHGPSVQTLHVLRDVLTAASPAILREARVLAIKAGATNVPFGESADAEEKAAAAKQKKKTQARGPSGSYGGGGDMPAVCANCGQDPSVRITDNPFIDLGAGDEVLADASVRAGAQAGGVGRGSGDNLPPRALFAKALAQFQSQLPPPPPAAEGPVPVPVVADPDVLTVDQAARLPLAGQMEFLGAAFEKVLADADAERTKERLKAEATVERVKASGKFLTAQVLSLQQVIEGLNDAALRVQHTLQEVKDYSEKERTLRLQGSITASNTMWVMVAQLYDSVKSGLGNIRESASPYLTPGDDGTGGTFDVGRAVEDARSYRDRVVQQAAAMEQAMEHRVRKAGGTLKSRAQRTKDRRRSTAAPTGKDEAKKVGSAAEDSKAGSAGPASAAATANAETKAALDDAIAELKGAEGEEDTASHDGQQPHTGETAGDAVGGAQSAGGRQEAGDAAAETPGAQSRPDTTTSDRSDDGMAERLARMREALDAQWQQRMREADRQRELGVKEAVAHLYDLLSFAQEAAPLPDEIARPCFRFLEAKGRRLRRSFKFRDGDEGNKDSAPPSPPPEPAATSAGGGHGRISSSGVSVEVQADGHDLPSVLDMHTELLVRGFNAANKLSLPAVLLRKALLAARDGIGKMMSNAALFDELSKLLRLELQNVMHPRSRELISMPAAVGDMYTRDSTTNTLLLAEHFALTDDDAAKVLAAVKAGASASSASAAAVASKATGGKTVGGKAASGKAPAPGGATGKAGVKKGGKKEGAKEAARSVTPLPAAADSGPAVSAGAAQQGALLVEEQRRFYDELSRACQTDPALTGVTVEREGCTGGGPGGGVDLEAITGTINQWAADDAAMEEAERKERAREEWYLTHPCVAVQAMPEVRSRTFQTQITGEVREVFRDINGAIVTKPPPSPPVGPDPPTPPEGGSNSGAASDAADATTAAAVGDVGEPRGVSDDGPAWAPAGSRPATPPPVSRATVAAVVDGSCQTTEVWPTAAAEARHAAIDDAAATVAEQAPPAAAAPPPLPTELVDALAGPVPTEAPARAQSASSATCAANPRPSGGTPPPSVGDEGPRPGPTTAHHGPPVTVAAPPNADRGPQAGGGELPPHGTAGGRKAVTASGVSAKRRVRTRTVGIQWLPPREAREPSRDARGGGGSAALRAASPPSSAASDDPSIGGSFDDRENGGGYDDPRDDDDGGGVTVECDDDDDDDVDVGVGSAAIGFTLSVDSPGTAPRQPPGASTGHASLYHRRNDDSAAAPTIALMPPLLRTVAGNAAHETAQLLGHRYADGHSSEDEDDGEDDDDVDLNDDGDGADDDEPGVGADGRTMTAPLSPSQALALLTGDWQALSGIVPAASADGGGTPYTPYEAGSAGSNGYDPSSPTKPLSKMKKSALLRQAQQAAQFHGQLQQAQVLLMQQQQVIAHLQATGLRLQKEGEDARTSLSHIQQRLDAARVAAQVDRAAASQFQRQLASLTGGSGDDAGAAAAGRGSNDAASSRRQSLGAARASAVPPLPQLPADPGTDHRGGHPAAGASLTEASLERARAGPGGDSFAEASPREAVETFVTALQRAGSVSTPVPDMAPISGGASAAASPAGLRGTSGGRAHRVAHRDDGFVVPAGAAALLPGPNAETLPGASSTAPSASVSAAVTPRLVTKRGKSHAKAKIAPVVDAHSALWGGGYGKMLKSAGSVGEDPLNSSFTSSAMPHHAGGIADVLIRMNDRLKEIEGNEKSREGEIAALREENARLRMGVGELASKASHYEVQLQVQAKATTEFKRRLSSSTPGGASLHEAQVVLAERDVCLKKVAMLFDRYAPGEVEAPTADGSGSGLVALAGLVERVLRRAAQMRDAATGAGASLGEACRGLVLKHFPTAATQRFDVDPDIPVLTLADRLQAEARKLKAKRAELGGYEARSVVDTVREKLSGASMPMLLRVDKLLSTATADGHEAGELEAGDSGDFLLAEVMGSPTRRRKLVGRLDMNEGVFPVADHVRDARDADAERLQAEAERIVVAENLRECATQTFVPRRAAVAQTVETSHAYAPPGFLLKLRPTQTQAAQTTITTAGLASVHGASPEDDDARALFPGATVRRVADTTDQGVQAAEFVAPKLRDLKATHTSETQTRGLDAPSATAFRSGWPWRAQIARLYSRAADTDTTADVGVEWLRGCFTALLAASQPPPGPAASPAPSPAGAHAASPPPQDLSSSAPGSPVKTKRAATDVAGAADACLRLMRRQLDQLREVLADPPPTPRPGPDGQARHGPAVVRYALAAMLERGLTALNDAMRDPLSAGLTAAASHVESGLVVRTTSVAADDLNHVIQRMLARIDVRLVRRDLAAAFGGSQRAINQYHQRVVEALVDNAASAAAPAASRTRTAGLAAYAPEELAAMQRLCAFEAPLTPTQQRRLSELQIVALGTVMGVHATSSSFQPLAIAAGCCVVGDDGGVDGGVSATPAVTRAADAARILQLSLAAPSAAAGKVARIAVCRKVLPRSVFDDLAAAIQAPPPSAADGDAPLAIHLGRVGDDSHDAADQGDDDDGTATPGVRDSTRRFIADVLDFPVEALGVCLRAPRGHVGAADDADTSRDTTKPSVNATSSGGGAFGRYRHAARSLKAAWGDVSVSDRLSLFHARGSWLLAQKPCDDVPFVRWLLLCGEVLRRLLRTNDLRCVAAFEPVDLGRARDVRMAADAARVLAHARSAVHADRQRGVAVDGPTQHTSTILSPSRATAAAPSPIQGPSGTLKKFKDECNAGAEPPGPDADADAGAGEGSSSFAALLERRRQQKEREAALVREAADIAASAAVAAPTGQIHPTLTRQHQAAVSPIEAFVAAPDAPIGGRHTRRRGASPPRSPLAVSATQLTASTPPPFRGAPVVAARGAGAGGSESNSAGRVSRANVLSPLVPHHQLHHHQQAHSHSHGAGGGGGGHQPLSVSAGRLGSNLGAHRAPPARLPRMQDHFAAALREEPAPAEGGAASNDGLTALGRRLV